MTAPDPFLDLKSSVEGSKPRFLYEIRQNLLVVYRITSGDRDISWNGYTWTAGQILSSELGVSSNTDDYEVALTLPIKHPVIQRYMAQQSPPHKITVTIWEYQPDIGLAEQQWIGETPSISIDMKAHTASLRIPSRLTRSLERNVSSITAGFECPHLLYGIDCRASDEFTTIFTTVTAVDGRQVTADISPYLGDDQAFVRGDLTHVATGESMTIVSHASSTGSPVKIQMQAAIPEIKIGDSIRMRRGCDHSRTDCVDIFANLVNFGGFPHLPTYDLFVPGNEVGIFGTPPETD